MGINQLIGIVALVLGAVLLGFGIHSTNAPVEKLSDTLLGHYSDVTMWYLAGGAGAGVGGVLLALFGSRS